MASLIRRPIAGVRGDAKGVRKARRRAFLQQMMAATLKNASQSGDVCASTLKVQSPAKINLTLEVLGRRADGYHDLRSVVAGIDLNDSLAFQRRTDATITLTCDDPDLPTDDRNLVVRAAQMLAKSTGCREGVSIELNKRIPLASGLGGGSGNAAATLAALNRLWGLRLGIEELSQMGAQLGSDVPLFFALPSARISGRGDEVERVDLGWSGWVLLVFAGCTVSTADVYAAWSADDLDDRDESPADAITQARTADEVAGLCRNDLEPAVFRVAPRVQELHKAIGARVQRPVRVSGAGQTVFIPFDDRTEAEDVRLKLQSEAIGTGSCLVRAWTDPLKIA